MQNVSFKSVDEFLEFLPEDELKIVEFLRVLIFDCVPGVVEKLSYNVPFYRKNKGLFFIWPASILWGNKKSYKGVRFGFQQGYLLSDEIGFLDRGERKQVYYKDYTTIKEADAELLRSFIFEAAEIDEQFKKKK